MKTSHLNKNIHHALQSLKGDPKNIAEHYNGWAETYNADVLENYYGINYITDLMHEHAQTNALCKGKSLESVQIIDVGCGTGLLGKPLHDFGYKQIDGIDLSLEMIEKARATGLYNQFFSEVNINHPFTGNIADDMVEQYDVAICLGVFTPGHVDPSALNQLISMTRKGGLVIISARTPYYDETNYQEVSDAAIASGSAKLVDQRMDAPYRDDGDAHYWVYEAS